MPRTARVWVVASSWRYLLRLAALAVDAKADLQRRSRYEQVVEP
jgi:hypothetical protein